MEEREKEGRERKKGRERVRERNLCINYENYHQFPGGKKREKHVNNTTRIQKLRNPQDIEKSSKKQTA